MKLNLNKLSAIISLVVAILDVLSDKLMTIEDK